MKKLLILLMVSFLAGVSLHAQKTKLRYKLEPGMSFTMETSFQTSMIQRVMGINQEILMEMLVYLDGEVKNSNQDAYSIEYRYRRLKITTTSDMFAVEIDTEGPDNPQNRMMRVLIGKPFLAEMDDRGRIKNVQGLDKIISSVDSISGIDEETRETWRISLEDSFGKEAFVQNMEQASVFYPEEPVRPGESWQYDFSATSSNIELNLRNIATLKETGRNTALIRVNSSISTPGNDSVSIGGSRGTITMNGKQISEISVELATGLLRESNVSQDIRGKLLLENDDQPGDLMEIPMTMTSKIHLLLNRKPD